MKRIERLDATSEAVRCGAVSIGNFDGVHRGHARIVERLLAMAATVGGPAVVFSFEPHPARVLRPHLAPTPLVWPERKVELLARLGVDAVVLYPTDERLLEMTAPQFCKEILIDRLAVRGLVEGTNFFFGRDRVGNVETLRQFARQAGIALEVVPPLEIGGRMVSSSRIRELIAGGEVEAARTMLTEPYRICGRVVPGSGRGAELGFPTANLSDIKNLIPGEGIFAGRAAIDGGEWPAAISVGPNPTFDDERFKVEVYLDGLRSDLYGRWLEVEFLKRLRDVKKYRTLEELVAQLARDVAQTREIAGRVVV